MRARSIDKIEVWDDATKSFVPVVIQKAPPGFIPLAPAGAPPDFRSCLHFSSQSFLGVSSPATAPTPVGGPSMGSATASPNAIPSGGFPQAGSSAARAGYVPNSGFGNLNYSGSTLSSSQHWKGSKTPDGVRFKLQKRMEMIVRLENAAIPDPAIAAMLCITPIRLYQIKKSVEYLKARQKITLGIIIDHDAALADIKKQRKEALTAMLPAALQVIANAIQSPQLSSSLPGIKVQVAAAQDLLDREGTYAKVSRSEVRAVDKFDWDAADAQGRSIFEVLRSSQRHQVSVTARAEIEDTIELSRAFSNSKTLDPTQQQAALEDLERVTLAAMEPATERVQ